MNPAWIVLASGLALIVLVLGIGITLAVRADRRRQAVAERAIDWESERKAWTALLDIAARHLNLSLSEPDDETTAARQEIADILRADSPESPEGMQRAFRLKEAARSLGVNVAAIRSRAEDDATVARLRLELAAVIRTSLDSSAPAAARLTALVTILTRLAQHKPDVVARVLRDFGLPAGDDDLLGQLRQRYLEIRSQCLEDLLVQGWNAANDDALSKCLAQILDLLQRDSWTIRRLQLDDNQLTTYYQLLARLPKRTDDQLIDRDRLMTLATVLFATDTEAGAEWRIACDVLALQILVRHTAAELGMGAVQHARLLHTLQSRLSEQRIAWLESDQK